MEILYVIILVFMVGGVICFIIDGLKGLFGMNKKEAAAVDELYNNGIITLNEAREMKGLKPLENGDKLREIIK